MITFNCFATLLSFYTIWLLFNYYYRLLLLVCSLSKLPADLLCLNSQLSFVEEFCYLTNYDISYNSLYCSLMPISGRDVRRWVFQNLWLNRTNLIKSSEHYFLLISHEFVDFYSFLQGLSFVDLKIFAEKTKQAAFCRFSAVLASGYLSHTFFFASSKHCFKTMLLIETRHNLYSCVFFHHRTSSILYGPLVMWLIDINMSHIVNCCWSHSNKPSEVQ